MATVTHQFDAQAGKLRTTDFPALVQANGTNYPVPGYAFDAAADEAIWLTFVATSYGSGNVTVRIFWYADTASSGTVVWECQMAAITANVDTQDIETDALDTLNFVQDTHLGTTAQRLHSADVAVSNTDSVAAGDYVTLRVARDADGTSATDSMTGDAIVPLVVVEYSDT